MSAVHGHLTNLSIRSVPEVELEAAKYSPGPATHVLSPQQSAQTGLLPFELWFQLKHAQQGQGDMASLSHSIGLTPSCPVQGRYTPPQCLSPMNLNTYLDELTV